MTSTHDLTNPMPAQPRLGSALLPFAMAACVAWLVAPVSVPLAAIVYVLAFVMLAWQRPDMALMVTLASAFSQHSLPLGLPVHVALGEANLALCLAVLCVKAASNQLSFRLPPILGPVYLYLFICLVASLLSWRGTTAVVSIAQMLVYLVAAPIVGATLIDHARHARPALHALVWVAVPVSVILITSDTQYILGLHKNGVGASLAMALIVGTELLYLSWQDPRRRRLLLGACAVIMLGLFFSLSRGAWLSAFAGIGIVLLMRRQYALTMRLALLAVPLVLIAWTFLPEHHQDYVFGFEAERQNIAYRYDSIDRTWAVFTDNPVFGAGVGLRNEMDATNIVLFTLAETGVIGLAAFLILHLSILKLMRRGVRAVSLWDPRFSLVVLGGALIAARFAHGLVDHYWSRGMLLVAWMMVGLATMAIFRSEADTAPEPTTEPAPDTAHTTTAHAGETDSTPPAT